MTDNAIWSGLGTRTGAAPPPPDDEPDSAPFEHRIVAAATAPSVVPPGAVSSAFAHPYQVADGSAAPSHVHRPTAARKPKEPTPMAKDPDHTPAPRNLQMRVGALLLANGPMSGSAIRESFADLTTKQLAQCMFQLKAGQRAERKATPTGDVWQLTASGKAWVRRGGGRTTAHAAKAAPPPAEPATVKKPRKAKKPAARKARARKPRAAKPVPAKRPRIPGRKQRTSKAASNETGKSTALAVRPFEPVVERSFRCAVFSDGAFHLAKNGQAIDLTAAEFAETLRYVERMAEVQA